MPAEILTLEHLSKRFNEKNTIHDISLSLHEGEVIAIYGQACSGKTTLLKLAAGVLSPTSGRILYCGEPLVTGDRKNSQNIGLLVQGSGVYSRLTAKEYLTFYQRLYEIGKGRLDEMVSSAGLIDCQDTKLHKFSVNQLARLRLAQVMLHKPKLLLLDSPTSGLDMETTEILRNMILKEAEQGAAILLTTAYQEEAHLLAGQIARLNAGRIDAFEKTDSAEQSPEDSGLQVLDKAFKLEKIPARVNDKIILFNPTELTYIESQEGVSVIHTGSETFQCPLTLSELEVKLVPFGFFRSHRSYIVNLQRVREVITWTRNSYSLVLDDVHKSSIPLSKNSLKELEDRLGM